jgi:addiction module RelE/StbE family toxin
MLKVVFSSHARRQFEKIRERAVQDRVARSLEALALTPLEGKPLQGDLAGCRSYRVGDYRIVYQWLTKTQVLGVLRVDHRKEVYR